jgi:uncharacterized membrane protein YphA (DoxX/SURF4 family)
VKNPCLEENPYLESVTERFRNLGFPGSARAPSVADMYRGSATGRGALQRLLSTFPGGRPGVGLLLLRAAVGLFAMAAGIFCFSHPTSSSIGEWLLGLILLGGGIALALGIVTPWAAILVAVCFLGIAISWFPQPSWSLREAKVVAVGMIITAVAIALLGPGAFSLDGRLFGRREIVIPPSSHRPEQ